MQAGRPPGPDSPERGSTLPFVLVCWLVAALMVFGAIAASDAFLEQQRVQSACDGAALAAAVCVGVAGAVVEHEPVGPDRGTTSSEQVRQAGVLPASQSHGAPVHLEP